MNTLTRVWILTGALLAAFLAVAVPAQAAGVVNGGFETGTFEGWNTANQTTEGHWSVTSEAKGPLSSHPFLAPFEGSYDAVADETDPSSMALYQEVFLTPGVSHELSMELNYATSAPLVTPEPDTLNAAGPPSNQQIRVDVMKAGSAVFSLEPSEILVPVFATTKESAPSTEWTRLSANLTPYAGQTVRIRVVVVDNESFLSAGLDAVSITNETEPVTTTPITTPTPAPTVTPTCTVPKLAGKNLKAAKKVLGAADCKLGVVAKKKGVTVKSGKVVKQTPKSGAVLAAGTQVSVKLG